MIAGHNYDIAASDQPLHFGQDIAFDLVSNLIVDLTQVSLLIVEIIVADVEDQAVESTRLQPTQLLQPDISVCSDLIKNSLLAHLAFGCQPEITGRQDLLIWE